MLYIDITSIYIFMIVDYSVIAQCYVSIRKALSVIELADYNLSH